MRISVTQQHIDRGDRAICSSCPIALALKDAGWGKPWVGKYEAQDVSGRGNRPYPIPEKAVQFMKAFDNGRPVEPFEFYLGD